MSRSLREGVTALFDVGLIQLRPGLVDGVLHHAHGTVRNSADPREEESPEGVVLNAME